MQGDNNSKEIRCLCGNVSQVVTLQDKNTTTTTTNTYFCHCNHCRHGSGTLVATYHALKLNPNTANLVAYKCTVSDKQKNGSSFHEDQHVRFFCYKCGCHVFLLNNKDSTYFVAAGTLLDPVQCNDNNNIQHWSANDTIDGGLFTFLDHDNSSKFPPPSTVTTINNNNNNNNSNKNKDILPVHCHCQSIQFHITRPNKESIIPENLPFPDLLVPYHSNPSDNPDNVKWWVRDQNKKFLAGLCACNSCRKSLGFPIQAWCFIPKVNILVSEQGQQPLQSFSQLGKTIQCFESLPGIYREFCNKCGATLFWHGRDRPFVVDVSLGLLNSSSGALALDWLSWPVCRVSFSEDALDKSLVSKLESGLSKWLTGG